MAELWGASMIIKKKKKKALKDDSMDATLSLPQPFVSTPPIN